MPYGDYTGPRDAQQLGGYHSLLLYWHDCYASLHDPGEFLLVVDGGLPVLGDVLLRQGLAKKGRERRTPRQQPRRKIRQRTQRAY